MARTGPSRVPTALNGIKRQDPEQVKSERPTKRLKGLLEQDDTSDDEDSVSSDDKGVPLPIDRLGTDGHGFKVNLEFARRFEHNKKREELHKRG